MCKKLTPVLIYTLFSLSFLLPFSAVAFYLFGYSFRLANYSLFALIIALTAFVTVIFCRIAKDPIENKAMAGLFALLMLFSLANAVICLLECATPFITMCILVYIACCVHLSIKFGKPLVLKRISLILFILALLPICFFGFIAFIFRDFGQNTVVQSIQSPDGVYYAQVIDNDQGGLGGGTFVDVYKKGTDLYFFNIAKRPQRIYNGDWGEFMDMQIYWKDDSRLVINSVEYILN